MPNFSTLVQFQASATEWVHMVEHFTGTVSQMVRAALAAPRDTVEPLPYDRMRRTMSVRLDAKEFARLRELGDAWKYGNGNTIRRCFGLPTLVQGQSNGSVRTANVAPPAARADGFKPHADPLLARLGYGANAKTPAENREAWFGKKNKTPAELREEYRRNVAEFNKKPARKGRVR